MTLATSHVIEFGYHYSHYRMLLLLHKTYSDKCAFMIGDLSITNIGTAVDIMILHPLKQLHPHSKSIVIFMYCCVNGKLAATYLCWTSVLYIFCYSQLIALKLYKVHLARACL